MRMILAWKIKRMTEFPLRISDNTKVMKFLVYHIREKNFMANWDWKKNLSCIFLQFFSNKELFALRGRNKVNPNEVVAHRMRDDDEYTLKKVLFSREVLL